MKSNTKRKVLATLMVTLTLTSLVTFSGCGNRNVFDNWGNSKNTFKYVVVEENGHNVLHQIGTWADSESESATFTTKCCDNYIWASANNAVFYQNKPSEYAYDFECGCEK